ncbi:type II toxin-antitoxin system HicB family antitoxin [Tissierella creatinini]|nr:type II toxin-antitoxin system HicB family antitoxin [Tissierella creatinini]TJX66637.1 type II toxin-antitoxin system HicB family antitoxin [Soehngenia saccharolytica]
MKSLDYYMNLKYEIDFKKNENNNGYLVSLPELKGCNTVAEDVVDGMERIQKVKEDWIIKALEKNHNIPEPNYSIE